MNGELIRKVSDMEMLIGDWRRDLLSEEEFVNKVNEIANSICLLTEVNKVEQEGKVEKLI